MDTLQFFLIKIAGHFEAEVGLLAMGIVMVYLGRQTQRVPEFHPMAESPADKPRPPLPDSSAGQLVSLGFKPVAKFDASMNSSVTMVVDVFLSADQLCLAAIVKVCTATATFSFIEFDTNLSPIGNITTNNNNQATIFYRPSYKMIAKVPWQKNVAAIYSLHQELCQTARDCSFIPVTVKPEGVRECFIHGVRDPFDDQVKCGRMVKVSEDVYRASFKGAVIFVPLVWHRMIYGFFYNLIRPSNRTFCNTLRKRLQTARLMREPYAGARDVDSKAMAS